MMEGLMTDRLHHFAIHRAINSFGRTNPSAEALCWEDGTRAIKVIALKQQALFEKRQSCSLTSVLEVGGLFSMEN